MLKTLGKVPFIRRNLSKFFINKLANATSPRPRALSLFAPYTTWRSLTDRTWTGRHLPPSTPEFQKDQPPVEDVVALFRRDKQIDSTDTSVMFMFFAQWFTDSFLRTDLTNRKKNTSNHEIDLCQLYGLTEDKTDMLRSKKSGRLKSQIIPTADGVDEEYPPFLFEDDPSTPDKFQIKDEFKKLHHPDVLEWVLGNVPYERKKFSFAMGLEHGNTTIGYGVINTLFLREHNRIAGELAKKNPAWDDERLFQTTRNIMIVFLLKIVISDYISHISPAEFPLEAVTGFADRQFWNRTNWIAIEFNLLYRWHSLIPDTIRLDGAAHDKDQYRNNNDLILKAGIDKAVNSFSGQKAARLGLHNTPQFMCEAEPGRESIKRLSVGMSRNAELRSFNDYREQFGLKRLKTFEDLTVDPVDLPKLKSMYGDDIDRLEWYVGLFAESYGPKSMMGGLLLTMVAYDAFTQALTNPLLSRNVFSEETFSPLGMTLIEETETLDQITQRNVKQPGTTRSRFKV